MIVLQPRAAPGLPGQMEYTIGNYSTISALNLSANTTVAEQRKQPGGIMLVYWLLWLGKQD